MTIQEAEARIDASVIRDYKLDCLVKTGPRKSRDILADTAGFYRELAEDDPRAPGDPAGERLRLVLYPTLAYYRALREKRPLRRRKRRSRGGTAPAPRAGTGGQAEAFAAPPPFSAPCSACMSAAGSPAFSPRKDGKSGGERSAAGKPLLPSAAVSIRRGWRLSARPSFSPSSAGWRRPPPPGWNPSCTASAPLHWHRGTSAAFSLNNGRIRMNKGRNPLDRYAGTSRCVR